MDTLPAIMHYIIVASLSCRLQIVADIIASSLLASYPERALFAHASVFPTFPGNRILLLYNYCRILKTWYITINGWSLQGTATQPTATAVSSALGASWSCLMFLWRRSCEQLWRWRCLRLSAYWLRQEFVLPNSAFLFSPTSRLGQVQCCYFVITYKRAIVLLLRVFTAVSDAIDN